MQKTSRKLFLVNHESLFINLGFTLIEVLIAISIVAFLAAATVFGIKTQIYKGQDAQRKTNLSRIRNALEEYEKDNDCYPQPLVVACGGSGLSPYLDKIPCDPELGTAYYYEPLGSASCPSAYHLYSMLKNKTDPIIALNGCTTGCGPVGFNYFVGSPNAPKPTIDTAPNIASCTVTLSPSSPSKTVGNPPQQFTASVIPGSFGTLVRVDFMSSNSSLAPVNPSSVDDPGPFITSANPLSAGTVNVTSNVIMNDVLYGTTSVCSATSTLTINPLPPACTFSSLALSPSTIITGGNTSTVAPNFTVTNGTVERIDYTSSSNSVATVVSPKSLSPYITAATSGSTAGTSTITANVVMDGSTRCSGTSNLTVQNPTPTCNVLLALAPTTITVYGLSGATATVSNLQNGTVDNVNFSSSNTSQATVSTGSDNSSPYTTNLNPLSLGSPTITANVIMGGSMRCSDTEILNIVSPTNLALGKTSTASSSKSGQGPNLANDNSITTYWRTNSTTLPVYWQVDLATSSGIGAVEFVSRSSSGSSSRRNFNVKASNDASFVSSVVLSKNGGGTCSQSTSSFTAGGTWTCSVSDTINYRYLRFSKTVAEDFEGAEFRVWSR